MKDNKLSSIIIVIIIITIIVINSNFKKLFTKYKKSVLFCIEIQC